MSEREIIMGKGIRWNGINKIDCGRGSRRKKKSKGKKRKQKKLLGPGGERKREMKKTTRRVIHFCNKSNHPEGIRVRKRKREREG